MTRLVAGGAVLVALAAATWLWSPGADDVARPAEAAPLLPDGSVLTVYVSGAVAEPGLVELAAGARVADAVAAAGGTVNGASLSTLNLAAPVRDGEQVHVPDAVAGRAESSPVDDGRVPVNRAPATELEALPGVGPVLAARIVAFREEHGPFDVVEDLLDVPGIGEAKLSAMRDLLAIP